MTERDVEAVLVDDEPGVRLLARLALETAADLHVRVVGEAGDGRSAVELAASLQPDLMLLDVEMPVLDGLAALPEVLRVSPATTVLVVSGSDADRFADAALRAGAAGYLEKSRIRESLACTVRAALRR